MGYVREFTHTEHQENIRKSRDIERKWCLSGSQMQVLRTAAREYVFPRPEPNGKRLRHDGSVSNYNLREELWNELHCQGFLAKEPEFNQAARLAMEEEAKTLIYDAFALVWNEAKTLIYDAFALAGLNRTLDSSLMNDLSHWRIVLGDLRKAEAILEKSSKEVSRITDKGREAVAEFLNALGIVED